jgi:DNA mismatch repair protein MutS
MIFEVDRQTLTDLGLINNRKDEKSIIAFYNRAITKGGQEMLYKLIRTPVADIELLEGRKEEINFFFKNDLTFHFISRNIDFIEYYLSIERTPLRNNIVDAYYNGITNKLSNNGDYWNISTGLMHIIRLLYDLKIFVEEARLLSIPASLKEDVNQMMEFISSKVLVGGLANPPKDIKEFTFPQISNLDNFIRVSQKDQFRSLLNIVYKIDVLQSLAGLMKSDGLSLPEYCADNKPVFDITEAYYPLLKNPIPNSFKFDAQSNLCFITGPNMAGKSTFLKTMGLSIYLAHLGFPVPAKKIKITVFDGIFTTINLSDNMNLGYSHFYSEVHRVKEVVTKLNSERNIIVIFDELFRGTNVKDAYDGSLLIISSLAKVSGSLFFISSHILEVAENLNSGDSIKFCCFESELVQQEPVYDFKLRNGVSKERIGMRIIERENILGMLNKIVERQLHSQSLK